MSNDFFGNLFDQFAMDSASDNPPTRPDPRQDVPGGGGLVRPKRRVAPNKVSRELIPDVKRNYEVSDEVEYDNYEELKNDCISAAYAQEIIEEIMSTAAIDTSNKKATKTFEDALFTFYIMNAASQRTSYDKRIDVYGVEFDFDIVLRTLVLHGVTPRRFTRGLADRIYTFIKSPQNNRLRAEIVKMHALESTEDSHIGFDGSTNVTLITNHQRTIANMMASRGIYENMASVKASADKTTYEGRYNEMQTKNATVHNTGT